MKKFEYMTITHGYDMKPTKERLDEQGAKGWELVTVYCPSQGVTVHVFKREVNDNLTTKK